MSRQKGGKNKMWSQEEKLRIVDRYLNEGIGRVLLAREEGIASGLLYHWISKYQTEGKAGLINKKKTGNRISALHTSKSLTEEERLHLIITQQEIEIERLKKGYYVKGDGINKEYVIIKGASLK